MEPVYQVQNEDRFCIFFYGKHTKFIGINEKKKKLLSPFFSSQLYVLIIQTNLQDYTNTPIHTNHINDTRTM